MGLAENLRDAIDDFMSQHVGSAYDGNARTAIKDNLLYAIGKGVEQYQLEIGANLPPGGTAGQVLTKASDDDFDVVWADPPE